MNLVGRHPGRRVAPCAEFVPAAAVWQRRQSDAVAACRQIGVVEVNRELAIRRQHRLADRTAGKRTQASLVFCRERVRKLGEYLVKRAGFRVVDNLLCDLVRNALHQNLGHRETVLSAALGTRDRLVDDDIDLSHARKPVLEIFHCRQRDRVGHVVEVLHSAALVEGQQVAVELKFVNGVLQGTPKQLVVELIL